MEIKRVRSRGIPISRTCGQSGDIVHIFRIPLDRTSVEILLILHVHSPIVVMNTRQKIGRKTLEKFENIEQHDDITSFGTCFWNRTTVTNKAHVCSSNVLS